MVEPPALPAVHLASRLRTTIRWWLALATSVVALTACSDDGHRSASSGAGLTFESCRLKGVETEVRCATLLVAENRETTTGRKIPLRIAVIPALARQPESDAVFVFAGGPGQAATDVAGTLYPLFSKLNRDRDIVFVDQRGTGGSNRLSCSRETAAGSMSDSFDANDLEQRIGACAVRLGKSADLTRYTTTIAMQDIDEVRARLGYPRIDLWGGSYGTRAALEYLRLFPDRVRTMTLDGVAPASVKLPLSFGVDTHRAVVALVADCAQDRACAQRYPTLAGDLAALFAKLDAGPIDVDVAHPVTGRKERIRLSSTGLASLLRAPLYIGLTASLLPAAIEHASHGDYDVLAALSVTVGSGLEENLALGMHLSVLCSEDMPSITTADVDAAKAEAVHSTVDGQADPFAMIYYVQYQRMCAHWPKGETPPAYYASLSGKPGADVPTLLLSGGIDPATPPSHAAVLERELTHARHLVAPHVGHGVSLQGCAPDLIERFVKRADVSTIDGQCLQSIPRPLFFEPVVEVRRDRDAEVAP